MLQVGNKSCEELHRLVLDYFFFNVILGARKDSEVDEMPTIETNQTEGRERLKAQYKSQINKKIQNNQIQGFNTPVCGLRFD